MHYARLKMIRSNASILASRRTNPGKTWVACLLHFAVLMTCLPLAAQDAAPPRPEKEKTAPAESPEAPPRRIEEASPSIYYLKDKQGNLQPVPNFSLEEFEDLYKLKHQLVQGDQRPRHSLQQVLATGSVNQAGQAELSVQFRILVREDQWTRVPLRLDQAVLREPVQHQGGGEHFLSFERDGDGYVAWIRGGAGGPQQLTLKVLVPLAAVGQETRLRLVLPRATASELKFKVPYAKATARVSEGATLQTLVGGGKETELNVVGPNGEFELTWRPPDAAPGKAAALEVYGTIAAQLDGRGVETEAVFSVRSYNEAFDRFRIRLPPDAEFIPGNPSGYTVTAVDAAGASATTRQQVVQVQLAKRTVGPVEVRISTKRAADRPGAAGPRSDAGLELAGFEIPEAARHWGTIAVSVVGDWQVVWGTTRGLRQADQLPEAASRKDAVAGFEYFTQSASLVARLVPRKTRIGVEPEYIVLVERNQLRLDARLRYTVRGAKVCAVDVAMPDWQVDEVGPESVVAVDGVPAGASSPLLSLPLVSPTIGQFEVRLKAHRPLAPDAKSFSLVLPQPQASAPAAAVVAVLAADNVEIVPDNQATAGLLRQQAAVPLDLPVRQQEPLFYRSDAPKAVFAADLRRHRQKVTAGVASRAMLERAGGRVEQKFSYAIAYEPTDSLTLEVPRELGAQGRLLLSCDDQVLAPVAWNEETDDAAKPLRVRVTLPKARIGACELIARYAIPDSCAAADGSLRVPLVMPLDAEIAGNSVLVMPAAEQQVELVGGAWTVVEGGLNQPASLRTREFTANLPAPEILLRVRGEQSGDAAVVVDRAWIQSWLTKSPVAERQDRAVFRLTTQRHELAITLPEGAVHDQDSVYLNGKHLAPFAGGAGPDHSPLAEQRSAALRRVSAISFSPLAGGTAACWPRSDEIRVPQPG